MSSLQPEKKDKMYAGMGTVLFSCLLLILCISLGMKIPYPLPEEQGVEVNLGDSDDGFGTTYNSSQNTESISTPPSPPVRSSESPQEISTQSTERTIPLAPQQPQRPRESTVKPEPQSDPQPPSLNPDAVYTGKRNNTHEGEGSGEGNTQGNGDRGAIGGDPNSQRYDGTPGKGGVLFNLGGRSSKSLATPVYSSKDQGTVVVKIWVDRNGNVTKALAGERGTTVTDHRLHSMAEKAALQSTFTSNPNAPDLQIGTITYKFVLTQ